jgi:hypothetical protein
MTSSEQVIDGARAAGIAEVEFRGGQMIAATLRAVADEPSVPAALRAVLAAAPALERLDIAMADTVADAVSVIQALLEDPRRGLRYLSVGEQGYDPAIDDARTGEWAVPARELAAFGSHLPDLDELKIWAPRFAKGLGHPTLRKLDLHGCSTASWRSLKFPLLERLRWWLPEELAELMEWDVPECPNPGWETDVFPRLAELDFMDVDFGGDALTPELLGSPMVRHLEVIRLPWIEQNDQLSRLAHLRRIDVRREPGETIRRTLPMVHVVPAPPRAPVARGPLAAAGMYVTAEEALLYAWRNFSPGMLTGLPATVRSVAFWGTTVPLGQQRAFGPAVAQFAEVHMPRRNRFADELPDLVGGDDLAGGLAKAMPAARWEVLDLCRAGLTRAGVAAISGALAQAPALHTLSLRLERRGASDVTDGSAAALAEGIADSSLRTLTLHSDFIRTGSEGRKLGHALPASLETIRLHYRTGPVGGCEPDALAAFLDATRDGAGIRRIEVEGHPAPAGLAGILPPLEALAWREERGPAGLTGKLIAHVLRTQPALRELDLRRTDMGPADTIQLAAAVADHPALACLRLRAVMNKRAMEELAAAVRCNTSLRSLTFDQCPGRDVKRKGRPNPEYVSSRLVPVTPLAAAIAESGRTFDELSLEGPADVQQVLLDLLAADRLRAVELRADSAEAPRAIAALTRAAGLQRLSLGHFGVDRAGHSALCAALPALPVRELGIRFCYGLWESPAARRRRFLHALSGSSVEVLHVHDPIRELFQLAGTMPSLRRIRPIETY